MAAIALHRDCTKQGFAPFLTAGAMVMAATALAWFVRPYSALMPTAFFFVAVVLSAYLGNLRSLLLSAALAAMVRQYLMWRLDSIPFGTTSLISTGLFLGAGILTGWLIIRLEHQRALLQQTVSDRDRALTCLRDSEEQLRALSDATFDALVLHENGVILEANPAFVKMFSYSLEEVVGQNALEKLVAPESLAHVRDQLRCDAEGPYQAVLQRQDGTKLTAEIRARNVTYRGRKVQVTSAHDITERLRTEQALRESELEFRATFNNAAVGIALVGLDGGCLRLNDQLCRISGYDKEELLRLKFQDITHPEDLQQDLAQAARLLAGEIDHYSLDKRYVRKDGTSVWVNLTGSIVRTPEGKPDHFIAIVEDISERKHAEAALRESEARWSWALKGIDVGVWDWNLADDSVFFSTRWKNMLGHTEEEIGPHLKEWSERVHPEDRDAAMADVQKHLEGLTAVYQNEHRVRHKDGTWRWILDRGIAIRDAHGKPCRMIGSHTDITERKQAEEALRESETRFRVLFECLPLGTFLIEDDTLQIVDCNERAAELLGYSRDELRHMRITDIEVKLSPDQVARNVRKIVREGSYLIVEGQHRTKTGEVRDMIINARPICIHGRVLNYATALDITERKKAEAELRRFKEELELRVQARTAELSAANQELEAFTYSVSHDLRAPLRHIISFSGMLQLHAANRLDEAGERCLQVVAESAERMDTLMRELLSLSRIARAPLTVSPVKLNRVVEKARQELLHETADRLIDWDIQDLPEVRGDASLLYLVMLNLLSNALKYTGRRDRGLIHIGWREQPGEVVVFVRDNGAGFDMRFADKLFGVFQRLHRAEEFAGSGVGLASVRRIIQRHGGRTWAEGAIDAGATFYFSLPKSGEGG